MQAKVFVDLEQPLLLGHGAEKLPPARIVCLLVPVGSQTMPTRGATWFIWLTVSELLVGKPGSPLKVAVPTYNTAQPAVTICSYSASASGSRFTFCAPSFAGTTSKPNA